MKITYNAEVDALYIRHRGGGVGARVPLPRVERQQGSRQGPPEADKMPLLQFQKFLPDLSAGAVSAAKVEGVQKLLIRSKDVTTW